MNRKVNMAKTLLNFDKKKEKKKTYQGGYHTLQGDNSLKSVERFDHMMFVCRFQASR